MTRTGPHAGYGDGFVEGLRRLRHAHTGWLFDKDATGDPHRNAEDLLDDRGLRIIGNLFVPVVLPSLAIPAVVACASLGGTYGFAAGCHVLPLDLTNARIGSHPPTRSPRGSHPQMRP